MAVASERKNTLSLSLSNPLLKRELMTNALFFCDWKYLIFYSVQMATLTNFKAIFEDLLSY